MTNATVTSADGTMIAYERRGDGDQVILVNTVAEDRTGLSGLAGVLAEHFTVYSYDRRGRGSSGALWMAPEAVVASARQFITQ